MTTPNRFVSRVYINLNGSEVERAVMKKLVELVVDQHSHLPDMFTIRLRDQGLTLLDEGPFDLTDEIEIQAAAEGGEKVTLIKGEITALEPTFDKGMVAELTVRGYDKSHRLYRETKSKAYLNVKDSDLADEIAREAGLQAQVDSTSTVYEHVYQHNQSDLEFLRARAWRIGYECFVAEGTLYFRKPSKGSRGSVTLTWGDDLLTFQPWMSLAEQVDQVIVKGWDVDRQEAIVGEAQNGNLYPEIDESQDGASWASNFGAGKKVFVNLPVLSQAEADTLAAARMDEISGAFIEAEGQAFRRPELRAGATVELKGLGKRLSGRYLVTSASHQYTAEGLNTYFHVCGARTGMLVEQLAQRAPLESWPGVVNAVVTNTDDPKDWGRVKVKFPWMSEDAESNWARVLGLGAGDQAGLFFIPEVDDEVLVIFGHGDFNEPYVLGGLWNGQNAPPPEATASGRGERPLVRTWHSASGHRIAMYDNADNKLEILTAGGHQVILDDANQVISISSQGGHVLKLDDSRSQITLESANELEINAKGNLKIQAGANLDIEAGGQVNVKGAMINLN